MAHKFILIFFIAVVFSSCILPAENSSDNILLTYELDTVGFINISKERPSEEKDSAALRPGLAVVEEQPSVGNYPGAEIVRYAKTLVGTPYLYASADPAAGFDCSGFIRFVFDHFNIDVPRSSVEFTHRGKEVAVEIAQPGDLILFTGTDSTVRIVGHMGIVTENENGRLRFIHSSSGKAGGVTISPLEGYYRSRFVKVISVRGGV